MPRQQSRQIPDSLLRKSAEAKLHREHAKSGMPPPDIDARKLYHELQVHQIELEMMNEELTLAREKAEVALEKYAELNDFAPMGCFTLDSEGKISETNFSGAKLLSIERSNAQNRNFKFFISEDTRPGFIDFLKKVFAGNGKVSCEATIISRGNHPTTAYIEGTVAQDRKKCFVVVVDITERLKKEAEMLRLDRLNLVGQVAASLGHEVRNPMQTVRGFLQLFQDEPRYASDLEDLQLMIDELDRANSIITEFLTLAQNKRTPTRLQDLNTILKAIEPLLSTDALKTGCAFNLECGAIPEIILDEKEIRQLVINLVRNAIEVAPTGAVDIRTFMDGKAVVLQVIDTGPGIPAEVLDRLGTPFLTTKEGGTGLGLATSFSIARRHKATITPESRPGGTTFTVRFPVSAEIPFAARTGV